MQLTGGPGSFTRPVADSELSVDTLTEAASGAKPRRKKKRSCFHQHEPPTTDSSSYVCDLTADSDPDVPNDSKMLLNPTGDSDSARPPLKYKHGNTDTREVEVGVHM